MIEWLKEWQFWAAVASLIGGIFAVRKYVNSKKQQEFENYHKLIERMNRSLKSDETISLQVQQAAIFELRYYPRYKKLSIRLLDKWNKTELAEDASDTLKYLKKKYWYIR